MRFSQWYELRIPFFWDITTHHFVASKRGEPITQWQGVLFQKNGILTPTQHQHGFLLHSRDKTNFRTAFSFRDAKILRKSRKSCGFLDSLFNCTITLSTSSTQSDVSLSFQNIVPNIPFSNSLTLLFLLERNYQRLIATQNKYQHYYSNIYF